RGAAWTARDGSPRSELVLAFLEVARGHGEGNSDLRASAHLNVLLPLHRRAEEQARYQARLGVAIVARLHPGRHPADDLVTPRRHLLQPETPLRVAESVIRMIV